MDLYTSNPNKNNYNLITINTRLKYAYILLHLPNLGILSHKQFSSSKTENLEPPLKRHKEI